MKSKYVKVKMLVNTAYQGPRKEGDVVTVPEDFAKRWVKNGIAEYANGQEVNEPEATEEPEVVDVQETVEDEVVAEAVEGSTDYESMNAKELYALCKEKGIDVEPKKSKEYYLEKLS